MRKLVAKRPVLYRSTQYRAGDALPADNQTMVEAWLEAKSAEWVDEADDAPKKKAEPVAEAAEPEEAKEPEEPKKKTPAKKAATKKEGK